MIAEFNTTDGLPPIVIEKLNNNFRSVGNGRSSGSYIINQVIDSIAYMDLPDKPSINGVILVGDIDGDDLMLCPVDENGIVPIEHLPGYVPTTRTVNGKALTGDITLVASDIKMTATGTNTVSSEMDTLWSNISDLQDDLDAKAPKASPALTGTPTAPTATAGTNSTQIATTAFVANAVGSATAGALQYKGTATSESSISGQAYKKGWYYVVATAGTYFGKVCEVGDMLIAKQDKSSTTSNDWDAIQSNIEVLSNSEIDTLWAAA